MKLKIHEEIATLRDSEENSVYQKEADRLESYLAEIREELVKEIERIADDGNMPTDRIIGYRDCVSIVTKILEGGEG